MICFLLPTQLRSSGKRTLSFTYPQRINTFYASSIAMPKRKYQPAETFIHRRLNSPRSFRLLSLAASSDLSSQLMCDVFITSFDDNGTGRPKYEALSYVWGSPTGTIPFSCDSKELLITPNCDEALRYLRLSDRSRTLWIDAICIDQGDSEESVLERNNQITLMGEIYRNAERTLCWLGKGQIYTAGLFQLLRRVGDCSSKRELQKLIRYDGMCKLIGNNA